MLLGQNFGRRHDAGLKTVINSNEHGHQSDERLARSHVTLQQTIHLSSRPHVVPYLVHHPFLCTCQAKGQVMMVKAVEGFAHMRENVALVFFPIFSGVAQDIQLDVKQFLEF